MRLYFLQDMDPKARVQCENVKKISEQESIFGVPLLELRTVLQILQESDLLTVKKWPQAVWHTKLIEEGNEDWKTHTLMLFFKVSKTTCYVLKENDTCHQVC